MGDIVEGSFDEAEMAGPMEAGVCEVEATSCCCGATGSDSKGAASETPLAKEDSSFVLAITAALTTAAIASSIPDAEAVGSEEVSTMYSEMRPSTL